MRLGDGRDQFGGTHVRAVGGAQHQVELLLSQPLQGGLARGHVLEVTRGGNMVWEFWNPETSEGKRAGIYRFSRITDPARLHSLRGLR